jgi:hypothetical protein
MSSLLWAVGLIYCYCCARVVQGLDSAVVDATYRKIIPCILDNPAATGLTADSFKFPDDAEAHYQDLLNRTAKYRGHPTHYTKGFDGPWIENLWIENFASKPLSYFGGLIPIFVQFVDIHVHSFMRMGPINNAAYKQLYHELGVDLKALLRPNVLYMAVSQDDESITFEDLFKTHPNILTLSAGGFGHIPIPLVKGIMNYKPVDINQPNSYKYKSGFYGAPQNGNHRQNLLTSMENEFKAVNVPFNFHFGNGWEAMMEQTLFNLAPRGFGRTSYRLAEIIQVGRIPVFLYNDIPWIPYRSSNISVESIGFLASNHMGVEGGQSIKHVAEKIAAMSNADIQGLLERVHIAREHYTLPGVIAQIDQLIKDPFGPNGGSLRCGRVPESVV